MRDNEFRDSRQMQKISELIIISFPQKGIERQTNKQYITRPNCALDRRTLLCLYAPGFQRQILTHIKSLSQRSKKKKKTRRTKGASLFQNSLKIHKMHSLAS